MKEVWGPNRVDTRSLRVFITSLRKKLELDPSRPTRIITEPGIGYRLLMETAAASDATDATDAPASAALPNARTVPEVE